MEPSLGAIAQLVERFHGTEEVRSSILLSSTSRPAARRAVSRSAAARSGCRVRPVDPGNVLPQPLEVVELPSLLLEDVDHDVAVVDQAPTPVARMSVL